MTKKDFPRFSDAKIQFEVSQPQMKLILCAVSAFHELLDTKSCIEQLKSFLDDAERHYGFKFKKDYLQEHEAFKSDIEQVMDDLCDAFCFKRWEYREMLDKELHDYYVENYDPEILNLSQGQILRVDPNA